MFNFKKIASIGASALMMGATVALAAAANYPAPFVQNGKANVAIVTADSVTFDAAAATALNSDLNAAFVAQGGSGGNSGEPAPEGSYALFTSGTKLYLNNSLNKARTLLTSSELPDMLSDGDFSGNVDATYTQTVKISSHPRLLFQQQPTSDDDPVAGFALGTTAGNQVFNMTVTFDKSVNFTHTDSVGEKFNIFGQDLTVGAGTDGTNLVLYKSANTVYLTLGGSNPNPSTTITVEGVSYTVELLSTSDGASATIKVTNTATGENRIEKVNINTSKRILGLDVGVTVASSSQATNMEAAELTMGAQKIKFTSGSEVKVGSDDDIIDGTQVTFTGDTSSPSGLTTITIQVAAPDADTDALVPGQWFMDPVFGRFGLFFQDLTVASDDASAHEEILVDGSGSDLMRFKFTDYNDDEKQMVFINNKSQAGMTLADSNGNRIRMGEMQTVNVSEFAFVGNEDEGHLVKVKSVSNSSSSSYSDDDVTFEDVFSDTTYSMTPTAEGTGTVSIGGKSYTVTYNGPTTVSSAARFVRLNDPDTSGANMALYRTIQTSKGAKVWFYQPFSINVTTWDGISTGVNLTTLSLPDGDGYATATFGGVGNNADIEGVNVTCGGTTRYFNVTTTTALSCTVGRLTYNFTYQSANLVQLFLVAQTGGNIVAPALGVFEEKDDDNSVYNALIVKTEGSGTSDAKIGVSAVDLTWGHDFREKRLESDDDLYQSMDIWGTLITTDKSDSDQYAATISYPEEQVAAEVFAGGTSGVQGGGDVSAIGNIVVPASSIQTVQSKNMIVLGGSCVNSAARTLLSVTGSGDGVGCGAQFTQASASSGVTGGVGNGEFLVKSYNSPWSSGKIALLVAGWEAGDTANAVQWLKTQKPDTAVGKTYKGTSATSVTPIV